MLKYTREDIIRRTCKKLDFSNDEMKLVFESIIETISHMLIEEQSNIRIELRNFGIFEVKPTKAKPRARNPKTNKEVYIPPRRKIHFRAGKAIRDVIKQEWKI